MKSNRSVKNRTALENFLTDIIVLDWPKAAVRLYASVRTHLERLGSRIGEMDLLIAVHALHENLPLVTNNREEFRPCSPASKSNLGSAEACSRPQRRTYIEHRCVMSSEKFALEPRNRLSKSLII